MKPMPCEDIEKYRRKDLEMQHYGVTGEGTADGVFVAEVLSNRTHNTLRMISSAGEGWEHVSVSLEYRCPTWEEMCFVKDLFWMPEEAVFQLHPPASEYVNHHPHCLHLWRPIDNDMPLPPAEFVGPKS